MFAWTVLNMLGAILPLLLALKVLLIIYLRYGLLNLIKKIICSFYLQQVGYDVVLINKMIKTFSILMGGTELGG